MKNTLENYRGMCLMLTLHRGDFCCFSFSSCAFPGTRRTTEDPGESPGDREISSETKRFSQGLGALPRIQEILPGSRRFSWGSEGSPRDKEPCQHLFLLCSSFPTPLQAKPRSFPLSQDRGSLSDPSHQGILGFTSSTCHGRAEPALWGCVTVFPGPAHF